MLANRTFQPNRRASARRQGGVVMLVALIVLVVMTLAGIALMRSMDTSTMIAGNMAFKQAATHSADTGIETAIAYLEQNNAAGNLNNTIPSDGYTSMTDTNLDHPQGQVFWDSLSGGGANVCNLNSLGQGCVSQPEANANGNKISYMIQRLCQLANTPSSNANCAVVANSASGSGQNEGPHEDLLSGTFLMVYYRITVRVVGPRNSVSYVQSIVSL